MDRLTSPLPHPPLNRAAWLWIWAAFIAKGISLLRRLPENATLERALVVGGLAAIVGFLVAGLSEYNFADSEVGMTHFNSSFWFGDIEHPRIMKSTALFAEEVLPAFR